MLRILPLFVVFSVQYVDPGKWRPYIPPAEGPGRFGWDGVVRGASIVFFAYIGFEAVSTAGQEAKNPAKDMPFGIIGSLVACTVIYILAPTIDAQGRVLPQDLACELISSAANRSALSRRELPNARVANHENRPPVCVG